MDGTLLRWLDEYGALFVYKYLKHTFVTYKMEKTYFLKPAMQGDCIDFYVTNLKFDKISVNFDLVAKINSCKPAKEIINTNMTFVAIDAAHQKPQRLNPMLFEADEFEKVSRQSGLKYMSDDDTVFHNINHIEDMLTQLNMFKTSIPIAEYKKIFFAICYHDAIHIPGNDDNEEKSFELLRKDWSKVLDEDDLATIEKYILATKTGVEYDVIKKTKYADLIHDLDMISFIDYETMKNNDVKLKTEYSIYSPIEFYQHKLKYFKRLIKDGIFISSQYKKYNSIAIDNIKTYMKEIEELLQNLKENEKPEEVEERE